MPGQDAIIHSRQPEVDHPSQLPELVQKLKGIAGDIPVGVKLGAGKYLEKDMEWAVAGGVDFIAINGAEAATHGSAPILQDDFGLPTIFAIARAGEFIRKNYLQGKVSLIASGNIRTPGDMNVPGLSGCGTVKVISTEVFKISYSFLLCNRLSNNSFPILRVTPSNIT